MEPAVVVIIVIVAAIGLPVIYVIATFNRLVNLRTLIENAWSNIDTELKRRYDLIPNLVAVVKGYAGHEERVFERIATARAQAMEPHGDRQVQARDENQLVRALRGVIAVAENYPQLKANENFLELQHELANTENRIQAARRFYNGNVKDSNSLIQQFPSNLIARRFGFREAEFFEIESALERGPVGVEF